MPLAETFHWFTYIDNLLVASGSETEHLEILRILLERLEQNELVVNPVKCQFGCTEIDFLGHHITKQGTISTPLSQKVQAVRELPKPINSKRLKEFIGMINFYNRFYHILPIFCLTCTKPLVKMVSLLLNILIFG